MKLNAKKCLSKLKQSMTDLSGSCQGDFAVKEMLDEKILKPTVADVTLSCASEDDPETERCKKTPI